jgi:hypothetical protein
VATLRMFRLRPADTPINIRIVARVVQSYQSAEMEQALARIRWWQSWGFDPFEPTDEEEFYNRHQVRLRNFDIEASAHLGEPGYMSMPQGRIMSVGGEISMPNGWAMASAEAIQSNGITPETAWPYRINGRIVEAHDPRTNDYLIDGEWVAESDLLNLDDLPDM